MKLLVLCEPSALDFWICLTKNPLEPCKSRLKEAGLTQLNVNRQSDGHFTVAYIIESC